MRVAFVVGVVLALCGPSRAQDASAWLQCPLTDDEQEMLACYKTNLSRVKPLPKQMPAPAVAKAVSAEPAWRTVDVADLFVSPGKFVNKPIEIRDLRCFHAGEREYRCLPTDGIDVIVIAPEVGPDTERKSIEAECSEIRKVFTSPRCVKTVRLTPTVVDKDEISAGRTRMVFGAGSAELIPAQAPSIKRR